MNEHIYKMVELVGSSAKGTDDAIQNAITRAADTLREMDWFEVTETRGSIVNGKITYYQVKLKIGFRLEGR
jgi:flavin-binding protein dodecin